MAQFYRTFDPASIGFGGVGTREFRATWDGWVTVTRTSSGADRLRLVASIDSARATIVQRIPEADIQIPATLGQGGHVETTIARHPESTKLPAVTEADQILANLLPALVPELMAASDTELTGKSDTLYAQRPARRLRRTITGAKDALGFAELSVRTSADTSKKPTVDAMQGSNLVYVAPDGTVLGARLTRSYGTTTPVDLFGQTFEIRGTAADTMTVTRLTEVR